MSNIKSTLRNYVSDMLAVEKEIHSVVRLQKQDKIIQRFPRAAAVINHAEATLDNHIAALESHLDMIGDDPVAPLKNAVGAVLGTGAAVLDKLRTQQVSKMLRDDYTAISLAAVSYHMLHTTGLALQSQATADLAQRHLKDWAPIIADITHAIHEVVAYELQDDGLAVDVTVAPQSERETQEAWDQAVAIATT